MTKQEQMKKPRAEEREARIAKLRQKYHEGTYRVEAQKVSAKIIDAHLR